jgi:hypothetical protein
MPVPAVPDWLAKRDGSLAPGLRDHTLVVSVSNKPHYRLDARPAMGRFACVVTQTQNGKPIDDGAAVYPTADAAFAGGLDRLKQRLGW